MVMNSDIKLWIKSIVYLVNHHNAWDCYILGTESCLEGVCSFLEYSIAMRMRQCHVTCMCMLSLTYSLQLLACGVYTVLKGGEYHLLSLVDHQGGSRPFHSMSCNALLSVANQVDWIWRYA